MGAHVRHSQRGRIKEGAERRIGGLGVLLRHSRRGRINEGAELGVGGLGSLVNHSRKGRLNEEEERRVGGVGGALPSFSRRGRNRKQTQRKQNLSHHRVGVPVAPAKSGSQAARAVPHLEELPVPRQLASLH